jgi:hypothetical protein
MADSRNTPMDSRTISMVLRDAKTLQLEHLAVNKLMQLTAERNLTTYFQPSIQDNFIIYKGGSLEEVSLSGSECPRTAAEFYELAMAIKNGRRDGTIFYYSQPASKQTLEWLTCNILSDAAKACYLPAREELIEATLSGSTEASQHVDLKEHVLAGVVIKLPRELTSAEIRKLGSDLLIQHRKQNFVAGRPLRGAYYEITDGGNAGKLGQQLLTIAEQRRRKETEELARRTCTSQPTLLSTNVNTLFVQEATARDSSFNTPADYKSSPALAG